jgi:nucleotide-binding universal stress UspA family protein
VGSITKPLSDCPTDHDVPFDLSAPALQLKRVMICTDFSEASARAVEEAYRLCLRHGAELSLVHVLEHGDLSEWTDAQKELALLGLERRKELRAMAAKLATATVHVRPVFLDGRPTKVLLHAIQETTPDLVVVGTHGRRGLGRLMLGSTAEAIIRNAACAVMAVGPGCTGVARDLDSGPIVCATDFHEGASGSILYGAFLSKEYQVPLHCIHVLPNSTVETKNHIVATIMETALRDLQATCGEEACRPVSRAVVGRDVSRAIVEYAREVHASAVVLGVTRRPPVASHLPLRRTSRVLILAECPVFTLSHEKHVSPLLRSSAR